MGSLADAHPSRKSKAESREFNRHTTELVYLHMCIDMLVVSVAKSDSARRRSAIRVGW